MAYGQIHKRIPGMQDEALKKLAIGLSICENSAIFDSPSSCRITKSRFFREIGSVYTEKYKMLVFNKNIKSAESEAEVKAQAESYLRSAL